MPMRTCQHLEGWTRDPEIPVSFDAVSQRYLLCRLPTVQFPISYCIFCGGFDRPCQAAHGCTCGLLEQWASDSSLAFEFDAALNEFHVLAHDGGHLMVYYCPRCGGNALPSRRGDLFEEPSEEEIDEYCHLLAGAKTLEDVVKILGQPSQTFDPLNHPAIQKELYKIKDIKRAFRFCPPGKKIAITAQEMEDGELQLSYAGKGHSPE